MFDEKKYKYCSVTSSYIYQGESNWMEVMQLRNDGVGMLRLVRMTPSIYMYDQASSLLSDVVTLVDVAYMGGQVPIANEYMGGVVSLVGGGGSVTYPRMSYVYPYEQRDWVYPVLVMPGDVLWFGVVVSPSVLLSNVRCYLFCVFVFEDV